jgi:aspartyl-tRNA(Asn)/glutamyl-tRNA(Gln) amidotransferase subunit A
MPDLSALPAHRLSKGLADGEFRAAEIVDAFLNSIAARDSKLHSYVAVYADEARVAADAADKARRSGHAIGPLHGVPIALKDLIDIEGKVATGGSAAWRQRRGVRTATLARKLIAQGLIVIGKTHTVEFAMGGWGTNTHMGTPWNPWDMRAPRTPGGSSSGSGVAVAAGMAPWAIGTDTGGSVRLPASWCGLTGLKTTIGRVSTHGILPLSPTLDTPGPMARCVEDATLLFCAMQGEDPLDPRTLGQTPSDPWPSLKKGVRGMRFAAIADSERAVVAKDVLAAFDESLDALKSLGAEIVRTELPMSCAELGALNGQIMAPEGYLADKELIDDESLPLDPDVRPRLAAGKAIPAHVYLSVLQQREVLKNEYRRRFAEFDAFLTPTTTTTALKLADVDQTKSPAHFTRFVNFLDLCALSLPNGADSEGLPTSLQIVCPFRDEATALRIGFAYQSATVWHERRPQISL